MPARKCFALRDAQCRRLLAVLGYGGTATYSNGVLPRLHL